MDFYYDLRLTKYIKEMHGHYDAALNIQFAYKW